MRAKRLGFILLSVLLLMLPCREVLGETHTISYDITNFNIGADGDTISFYGWAFIEHVDNYGGTNTRVYIAAYTDSWTYGNDISACNDSSSCMYVQATRNQDYDLYFIRCTGNACSKKTQSSLIKGLKDGKRVFQGASNNTCTGGSTGAGTSGSHCTYHNVGFSAKMSINNIIKKIGSSNGSKVKFRIIATAGYGSTKRDYSKYPHYYKDSSDIGIISNSCSGVFTSNNCAKKSDNTKYTKDIIKNYDGYSVESTRTVQLGGIDDTVTFTAVNATGYTGKDCFGNCLRRAEFNSGLGIIYNVEEVGTELKDVNVWWKGARDGYTDGRLLKLSRSREQTGWAWTAWVKVSGSLVLDIKDVDKPGPKCSNENDGKKYCIGSGCTYDANGCGSASNPATPNSSDCSDRVDKTDCSSTSYSSSCSKSFTPSTYYYRLSENQVKQYFQNMNLVTGSGSIVKKRKIGNTNYYYFPISFYATVNYTQNATLSLNFGSGESNTSVQDFEVKSGRAFHYSYDYTVNSSWNYNNYSVSDANNAYTTGNNTYSSYVNIEYKVSGNNKTLPATVYISLTPSDILYSDYNNDNSRITYGLALYQSLVESKAKESYSNDIKTNSSKNVVKFKDSNDANSTVINDNAGTFSCSSDSVYKDNWNAGITRTVSCSYKVNPAYLKNDASGDIQYSPKSGYMISSVHPNGGWYYIPINLKSSNEYNSFPFNVSATHLSLINGITYTYTPLCNVIKAINEFDTVNYRTIDTDSSDEELKKELTASNWEEYIDSKGLSRITNSFGKVSYQTKNLKKISYDATKYGIYYSYDDVDLDGDGSSKFITDNPDGVFKTINRSHCSVKVWDASCDN